MDLDILFRMGDTYGCNALYRTHTPTVLVATDRPIAEAIQHSGYSRKNRFYTRRPLPGLGAQAVPKDYFGFSSGPIATALAAADHNTPVYLLGFDMGPGPDGRFNNVFAGTEFYKKAGMPPTFTGNWVRQLVKVMQDHDHILFVRVMGSTTADISELAAVSNLESLPMAEFLRRINNPKDL